MGSAVPLTPPPDWNGVYLTLSLPGMPGMDTPSQPVSSVAYSVRYADIMSVRLCLGGEARRIPQLAREALLLQAHHDCGPDPRRLVVEGTPSLCRAGSDRHCTGAGSFSGLGVPPSLVFC